MMQAFVTFILTICCAVCYAKCPNSGTANGDWHYDAVSDNCYYLSKSGYTWDNAQTTCNSLNANLASINADQQSFLMDLLSRNAPVDSIFWIGLRLEDPDPVSQQYSWINGDTTRWRNWDAEQPNRSGIEPCVNMYTRNGKWHDYPCQYTFRFICLASKTPVTESSDYPIMSVSTTNGGNQRIDCGDSKVIYIHNANYTYGECGYNVHVSVDGLCGRKQNCDLNPALYGKSGWFKYDHYYGVRCPGGINKVLNVDYSCRTPNPELPEFFTVAPQTEPIDMMCNANQRIFIRRAYYGYGDAQDDVTTTVRGICSRQPFNRCTYTPNIPEFSDYDGYWDFNTVYYYCGSLTTTVATMQYQYYGEGEKVNFGCPNGNVMAIKTAYWGTGGYQADVSVVVKSLCHNQYNCAFTASNAIFLDPRGGLKHLTIGYTCRPRQWNDYSYVMVEHDRLGNIDCQGQHVYIGEAFYGMGYIQEDVTASRVWDRCETRFPEPFINSYCVFGARDIYFGTVNAGKLTVGYYCSPHQHKDLVPRRTSRYMYGTGENRAASY